MSQITIKLQKVNGLELNEAYNRILHWFFAYPTKEITLTELTTNIKVSKTTANRIVKNLAKSGFLSIKPIGNLWRITCNQHHPFNVEKKVPYHLQLIYASKVIDEIKKNIPPAKSITLFGSYRKGDDIETSDLDLAVEVIGNEETKIMPAGVVPQLGYRKNVKVNILLFNRSKVDLNLFANIANGIVLYGFLEAKP